MHATTTAAPTTTNAKPATLLRGALKLDAVVSGANGLAYVALAGPLAEPLGVDALPLRIAGAVLVLFAAAVWALGARDVPRGGLVKAVVALNAVWAVDSILLVASGLADPVALGAAWIVAQALVVAGFAALQVAGLRRR